MAVVISSALRKSLNGEISTFMAPHAGCNTYFGVKSTKKSPSLNGIEQGAAAHKKTQNKLLQPVRAPPTNEISPRANTRLLETLKERCVALRGFTLRGFWDVRGFPFCGGKKGLRLPLAMGKRV